MKQETRMRRYLITALPGVALAAALALAAPMARAQGSDVVDGAAGDAMAGAELYALHCASCHGADGKGFGPLAPVLTIQPKDLTGLAAGNGGAFPMEAVIARIDGRDPLVAHGSPMPVFGPYLDGDRHVALPAASGQPIMVSQQVADLVAYLMSLQQ